MFPIVNPHALKAIDVQIKFNLSLSKFTGAQSLQPISPDEMFLISVDFYFPTIRINCGVRGWGRGSKIGKSQIQGFPFEVFNSLLCNSPPLNDFFREDFGYIYILIALIPFPVFPTPW